MNFDTVPALFLLALCCAAFLRFGCVRDSSPSDGTAGLQGDGTGALPCPGADRPEDRP